MTSCDICGRGVESVILQGPVHNIVRYCDMCWYYKNPPVLILTKLWDSPYFGNSDFELGNLYSPKIGKRVYPVKGQMEKCGFILFNKKIFFKRGSNEKYREVLVFKYRGSLQCLALEEYKAWPSHMKKCCKIGCNVY